MIAIAAVLEWFFTDRLCRQRHASPHTVASYRVDAVIGALDAQTVAVPAETTIGRVIAELAGELDRIFTRRTPSPPRSRRHS
jgi:integrase/recombinase XerD